MKSIIALAVFAGLGYCAGCLPVTSDRIYAHDLALADRVFDSLPATQIIGFAPTPGAKRVFSAADLRGIARANGVKSFTGEDVCFEIPMGPIGKEDLLASMRRTLPPGTDVTLIEAPAGNLPKGAFEFPLTALEPSAPGAGSVRTWRGSIRYGETLRMRILVRVNIVHRISTVIAAASIPRNTPIDSSQLRVTSVSVPFGQERGFAHGIEDVIGRVAKSDLAAGDPIPTAAIENPLAVRRGDRVLVEVESGQARIRMDAVAEISVRTGEQIDLRNPSSGKLFRARMADGGKAVVVVDARAGR